MEISSGSLPLKSELVQDRRADQGGRAVDGAACAGSTIEAESGAFAEKDSVAMAQAFGRALGAEAHKDGGRIRGDREQSQLQDGSGSVMGHVIQQQDSMRCIRCRTGCD